MLTIDCKDVLAIKNELLVYVADQEAAIPTLKNHKFTLSSLNDDEIIDTHWLTFKEIKEKSSQLRSKLVLECIEDYLSIRESGKKISLSSLKSNL